MKVESLRSHRIVHSPYEGEDPWSFVFEIFGEFKQLIGKKFRISWVLKTWHLPVPYLKKNSRSQDWQIDSWTAESETRSAQQIANMSASCFGEKNGLQDYQEPKLPIVFFFCILGIWFLISPPRQKENDWTGCLPEIWKIVCVDLLPQDQGRPREN